MRGPHEIEVMPDAGSAARRAAEVLAEIARSAVEVRGAFALAVSGGRSPALMFAELATRDVPWGQTRIWQADERVAPDGHYDRNLTELLENLPPEGRGIVRPMPVTDEDLEAAADRYAASLPERFDLVHLGLGDDGHTASLVPGDPVLDEADRAVAVTGEYRGRRRMTFTFPLLDRQPFVVWLVTGEDKGAVLPLLLDADTSIPAGRVRAARHLVIADRAAAAALE